jgi:hypothetical protein
MRRGLRAGAPVRQKFIPSAALVAAVPAPAESPIPSLAWLAYGFPSLRTGGAGISASNATEKYAGQLNEPAPQTDPYCLRKASRAPHLSTPACRVFRMRLNPCRRQGSLFIAGFSEIRA